MKRGKCGPRIGTVHRVGNVRGLVLGLVQDTTTGTKSIVAFFTVFTAKGEIQAHFCILDVA